MKKLYNIFLVLAIIGTICMRFAYAPEKSPNNLFVDDVVTVGTNIVNKNGEVTEIKGESDVEVLYRFTNDKLALFVDNWRFIGDGVTAFDFHYVNTKGDIVISDDFDYADQFSDGLAAAGKDGKYGYIDTNGNVAIDFKFDYTRSFNGSSIAPARIGKQFGYIDKSGTFVIKPQFDVAFPIVNGMARGVDSMRTKSGRYEFTRYIVNEKTREVIEVDYDIVDDFGENGLAPVCKFSKWGYINTKGEEVIKCQFREAGEFTNGIAPVIMRDKSCAYIDENGEIVMQFENFTKLGSFHNGLAWFADKNGKVGYINKKGEIVIEPQFELYANVIRQDIFKQESFYAGGNFYDDGYAIVETSDHKQGVIDMNGNYVLEPIYDNIG